MDQPLKFPAVALALACLALTPPTPNRPHKSAAVHQGAGAQRLLIKAPRVAVAPFIRLDWDFAGEAAGIVFNVRCLQGPMATPIVSWPVVATVTSNACTLPLDKGSGMVWFVVCASNTATGLESAWNQ